MKKLKFTVSVLLVAVMICFSLVACKKSTTEEVSGTVAATTAPEGNDGRYDANGYLKDDLPDDVSCNGAQFRIYSWSEQSAIDWGTHEMSSNVVEQALYEREINVKDRFDVTLDITLANGGWDDRSSFIQTLEVVVLSGSPEDNYHLVCQYTACSGMGAIKSLYKNLKDVKYLNFDKPWWPQFLNSSASVGDNLYFASGDITGTAIKNLHCMYVNLDLYNSLNIADTVDGRTIYKVVKDGDWTLQTQRIMIMDVTEVGGDDLTYGLTISNTANADGFFYGGGFKYVENADGNFEISKDLTNSRLVDWFDEVQALICSNKNVTVSSELFYAGKSLFYSDGVSAVMGLMRDVEFEYAILPVFKYDSEQEYYYTTPNLWVSMFSIPVTSPDEDMSGLVMEALASEGYRTLTDALYYDAFQHRYLSTDENAQIFDIITDNVVFDSARMFADQIGIFSAFRNGVIDKTTSWSSIYGSSGSSWATKIATINETLG